MGEFAKGSIGFQNQLQTGPTVIQQSSQGLFVYSGTPAAGNLLLAIAAVGGTDAFGNVYKTGLTISNSGLIESINGNQFVILSSTSPAITFNPNTVTFDNDGFLQSFEQPAGTAELFLQTPYHTANSGKPSRLFMASGDLTTKSQLQATADISQFETSQVNGDVIKSANGVPYTWQAPSYGANWSGSTSFNGNAVRTLKYRLDAEDNVAFQGCFAAGATLPANPVFNVPVPYRPASAMTMTVWKNAAGTLSQGLLYIATSGNVDLFASLGNTITASAQWIVNGRIPLDLIA